MPPRRAAADPVSLSAVPAAVGDIVVALGRACSAAAGLVHEVEVALAAGHHRLTILFFQAGGGRELALRVRRGNGLFEPVPDEWFRALQTGEQE